MDFKFISNPSIQTQLHIMAKTCKRQFHKLTQIMFRLTQNRIARKLSIQKAAPKDPH